MIVSLRNVEDTRQLAKRVVEHLRQLMRSDGVAIGLIGQLGAGKTTFVRYLVEALRGNTEEVASPSFTLQYEYDSAEGITIDHWDLYRLHSLPDELYEPCSVGAVRIIEWPDRCPHIVHELDLVIQFEIGEGDERVATISGKRAATFAH